MRIQNKVLVFRNPSRRATEIYVYMLVDGKISAAREITFSALESPAEEVEPVLSIDDEGAQELLQSLWDAGYRPANYKDESALKNHLEDMRKIAFKFLDNMI